MKKYKKLLSLLLVCFMLLGVLPKVAYAGSDVTINATNFPDENFRTYVAKFDTNSDGVLSSAELEAVDSINVTGKSISSLKGAEYFSNLDQLICDNNNLTELDVTKFPNLVDLSLIQNKVTSLDVSQNSKLKIIRCTFNQLTSLDVSHNPLLEQLNMEYNNITSINLANNPKLTNFSSRGNLISSFDFTHNPLLYEVVVGSDILESLDVSNLYQLSRLSVSFCKVLTDLKLGDHPQLYDFAANYTALESLDLSDCPGLYMAQALQSKLTTIDISNCPKLETLDVSGNDLTSINLSGDTALEKLNCQLNELTELDLSDCVSLKELSAHNNQLMEIDLSNNTELEYLTLYNNHLLWVDLTNNSKITTSSKINLGTQTRDVVMGEGNTINIKDLVKDFTFLLDLKGATYDNGILTLKEGATSIKYYYLAYGSDLNEMLDITLNPVYLPNTPTNVVAVAGDKQATVSFDLPEPVEGATITGYVVTSEPAGITATGTSSPITVTGLQNGIPYTFTVTAVCGSAYGQASEPSNSVVPIHKVTVVDTSVELPKAGKSPDNAFDDGYGWTRYAGNIVWTPNDNPFKGNTEYTATITISADKNMDVYTSEFTDETVWYVDGMKVTPVSYDKHQAVLQYTFPATKALESIAVTTNPTKTNYASGDDFNPSGMVVTAYYTGGTSGVVRNYTIVDGKNLANGQTTITISYTEGDITKTTTVNITVTGSTSPEIIFTDDSKYDIPESEVYKPIEPVDVSEAVSGGTEPFVFSAVGLPEGLSISSDGIISGTPTKESEAGVATVCVEDAAGRSKSITINYGKVNPHVHSYGEWEYDENKHWKECEVCGDKIEETHKLYWVIDEEATESKEGLKHQHCDTCGYDGDKVVIDKISSGDKPVEPTEPKTPVTGDYSDVVLMSTVLTISAISIFLAVTYKRKREI